VPRTARLVFISSTALLLSTFSGIPRGFAGPPTRSFTPVARFEVPGEVAEIVAATPDGETLVYTNSEDEAIGFVDISDPSEPAHDGTIAAGGEPTSVAVTPDGAWALAGIYEGWLSVIDLDTRTIVHTIALGGQPDSVALTHDGASAVIAIENERDEDVNDGEMPQAPAGLVAIVDLDDADPAAWDLRAVSLTGVADRFPGDPEPEFVDIDPNGIAAVTLQENNHVVLIDVAGGTVVGDFPAGTTSHKADLTDDDVISFTESLTGVRREPDAIAWTPDGHLITADEGDYDLDVEFVGGRTFTIFDATGQVVFDVGVQLEKRAAKVGLYDDGRSDNKGVEPEGVEVATFGGITFAFVGAERADFVAVVKIGDPTNPAIVQYLETGDRPEGLLALTDRGLLVTANEGDGTIDIFAASTAAP
jgi:hypothetical protein